MNPITNRQSPQIVDALNAFSTLLGNLTRDEAWERGVCAHCQAPVDPETAFTNDLSMIEYFISATCQACQDAFFGDDEENEEEEND